MAKRTLGTRLPADLGLESTNYGAATEQFERIKAALEVHGVVVLPQQRGVTREQLHAFAMRFGPIALHVGQGANEHPALPGMLTINDGFAEDEQPPEPGATEFGPTWHTDFAACVRPGYATVLHCRDTPTGAHPYERCDTMFADLVSAYDALEPDDQIELQRLKVRVSYRSSALYSDVFSGLYNAGNSQSVLDNEPSLMKNMQHFNEAEAREMMRALRPDVEHPLVRNVLGRPVLFIGQADTAFVVDNKEPDADEVEFDAIVKGAERLRELQIYATQPQFQHNHIWAKHDVVIWDNRQVIHRADYSFASVPPAQRERPEERRIMWHVGTKDPVRPLAWDPVAVGECLTPVEPPSDQWVEDDGWPDVAKL